MASTRWLPLESNPEVMNKYVHGLGVPDNCTFTDVYALTDDVLESVPRPVLAVLLLFPRSDKYVHALGVSCDWNFTDVWGLEPELLSMVNKPVAAVVLLYPISEKAEKEMIGKEVSEAGVYFMKQTISNACGTVGIIHAVLNNTTSLSLSEEKHLFKFLEATKDMSPEERAKYLEEDMAFGEAHEESAQEGQTQTPSREDQVNLHFVAFVHHNGSLFELDGRKSCPVLHGSTTPETILEDTACVVKKFMARDPEELNFNVIALAKTD